eukprot:s2112_g12.t1
MRHHTRVTGIKIPAMTVRFSDYAMVSIALSVINTDKANRKTWKIKTANVTLEMIHRTDRTQRLVIKDTIRRLGAGAFKDVFFFDSYQLVLKMMVKEFAGNSQHESWAKPNLQEQGRYDEFKDKIEDLMMSCYGSCYISGNVASARYFENGTVLHGPATSSENAYATVTLAERLNATGLDYTMSIFSSLECSRQQWQEYALLVVSILKMICFCLHKEVLPWDAKLNNVALRSPRKDQTAGDFVFCDLDGFRASTGPGMNLGGKFVEILKTMLKQDKGLLEPFPEPWPQQMRELEEAIHNLNPGPPQRPAPFPFPAPMFQASQREKPSSAAAPAFRSFGSAMGAAATTPCGAGNPLLSDVSVQRKPASATGGGFAAEAETVRSQEPLLTTSTMPSSSHPGEASQKLAGYESASGSQWNVADVNMPQANTLGPESQAKIRKLESEDDWCPEERKFDVWADTISVDLLQQSSLLVCRVTSKELRCEAQGQRGARLSPGLRFQCGTTSQPRFSEAVLH